MQRGAVQERDRQQVYGLTVVGLKRCIRICVCMYVCVYMCTHKYAHTFLVCVCVCVCMYDYVCHLYTRSGLCHTYTPTRHYTRHTHIDASTGIDGAAGHMCSHACGLENQADNKRYAATKHDDTHTAFHRQLCLQPHASHSQTLSRAVCV
jgi:hypothetical protein